MIRDLIYTEPGMKGKKSKFESIQITGVHHPWVNKWLEVYAFSSDILTGPYATY